MEATRKKGTALLTVIGLLTLATLLGACGEASTEAGAQKASAGRIAADAGIPAPQSKTVLTVTGAISKSNSDEGVDLDLATLEDMPIVEATLYEPFVKRDVTFSGVMLDDFLTIVGADEEATSLFMTALDDYTVDLPMAKLDASNAMIATREAGQPIKLRAGGPARIVFLNGDDGISANPDMWIWSVRHIEVKA